jgi:hypothetical protein
MNQQNKLTLIDYLITTFLYEKGNSLSFLNKFYRFNLLPVACIDIPKISYNLHFKH